MVQSGMQRMVRYLRWMAASGQANGVTDAELLQRFVSGRDEAAFELLLWRHGPMVWGTCRRWLRDGHEAEDVFQATFLALFQQAASIANGKAIGGWLHKVACRIALRVRNRNTKMHVQQDSLLACVEDTATGCGADAELSAILDEELLRLPEKYRLPLVLCYLEENSTREAARLLGCPKGTLLSRLKRGRDLLRSRLRRRGVTLPATALPMLLSEQVCCAALPRWLVCRTLDNADFSETASELISSNVLSLTRGVTSTMFPFRTKLVVVLLLLLGMGTIFFLHQASAHVPSAASKPQAASQQTSPKPQPNAARKPKTFKVGKEISRVKWSPNGKWMAGYAYRRVKENGKFVRCISFKIWNTQNGNVQLSLGEFKNKGINMYGFSPDSRIFAMSRRVSIEGGDHIDLWDVAQGLPLNSIDFDYGRSRLWFAFAPDSKTVAVAYGGPPRKFGGGARILDVRSGKQIKYFLKHDNTAICVAYAPDGKTLATSSHNGEILIWNLQQGKAIKKIGDLSLGCRSMIFTPDGKHLTTCSVDGVFLWNLKTGKGKGFQKANLAPWEIAVNSKGTLLATAGTVEKKGQKIGEVNLWNLHTGNLLHTWENTASSSIAFTPDGDTLAILHPDDGMVRYWDVRPFLKE